MLHFTATTHAFAPGALAELATRTPRSHASHPAMIYDRVRYAREGVALRAQRQCDRALSHAQPRRSCLAYHPALRAIR